jgi:hypothetical protein
VDKQPENKNCYMPTIHKRIEHARGCGYKKKGGLYLIGGVFARECYKLPIALTVCPCCGEGIKPSRGFTWISSDLFAYKLCTPPIDDKFHETGECEGCAMSRPKTKMGLIWVGEKFYKTPKDFTSEAAIQGISRRIAQVPKELEIGKTWICFAHRKAVSAIDGKGNIVQSAGIFHAFIPQRIEYVVTGKESTEELTALEKRGFTLIDVVRDIDGQTKLTI